LDFLGIKSPVNFLQLGRYGKYGEQRYRQQFEGSFDSFNFNAALINQYCGQRRTIAFDPSYIPKSWRETVKGEIKTIITTPYCCKNLLQCLL
jgi:hypothetical protein